MSLIKCKFCNPETDCSSVLRSFLPAEYDYIVCNFSGDSSRFKTRLRTNGGNQDHAHKWLEDFHMYSKCTMRVERTYPHSGTKNVFKVDLRCQHNTRPRSDKVREKESCKNTDCPAKMVITIKRVVTERKSRSKDPHLPNCPTVIQMDFCHNHAILTPDILKHRSVLPEVKEKILALFKLGHNPGTALDMHRYDLLLEHGENFEKICHDRALLPDPQYCYRLYYKIVRKHSDNMNGENTDRDVLPAITTSSPDKKDPLTSCENSATLNNNNSFSGGQNNNTCDQNGAVGEKQNRAKKKRRLEVSAIDTKDMSRQLEEMLCKFCESGGLAGMQLVDKDTVMALCTPLMNRVHRLVKQSGDMVFVDSYGDLDEPNTCRVLYLTTYSSIGPVPLACLVTTSENVSCIKAALDLLKQIIPTGGFFGKERPDLFFTNDHEVVRTGLKTAFPKSHLLICLSHILQASWTFVWDKKNGIKRDHRSILFSKIRLLLFSQTVEELEMNYAFVADDGLVKTYPLVVEYLKHIYDHRHDWSLVYRRHLIPSASNATFFWESAMILLKDPILSRSRTYNPLQVIDFMSRLDTYYERKLIDLANHRFDSVRFSRFLFIELPREAYTITQNSESEYEVHNDTKDTTYQTEVTLGMCECKTGKSGAPCKHQLLVYRNFPVPAYDYVPPTTQMEKNILFHLATGQEVEIETAQETIVPKTVQPALHHSIATIHDVYNGCGDDGHFFLDDGCEALSAAGITHAGVLAPHSNSSLTLQASSLSQSSNLLLQHQNPPEVVLVPQHNLMTQLDPSANHHSNVSSLNQQISSNPVELSQHLSTVISPSQPPPCPPNLSNPHPEPHSVSDLVVQICSKLKDRTSGSPQVFRPALQTFLKNLDDLSADSSLENALYSFGKFCKPATVMFKRRVVDNKLVGLQSAGELKREPAKFSKPS